MTVHYIQDTGRLGLGRPDHEPLATESVEGIVDLISALVDGGHAYEAGGDVYFRVRSHDGYGELSRRDVDQMDQGEGVEGADRKEDPLDFALWKATKEGEDTSWDSPWGARPPGLAHRVLRDGRAVPGRGLRHPRRRHRPRLPAPRERGGADAGRARASRSRACGCTTGCCSSSEEKMSKSLGNIRGLGDVLDAGRRRGARPVLLARPLPPADRVLRRAAGGGACAPRRASARRGGAWCAGESPEDLAPLRDAFFDALADDFNTARALAALFDWIREANRREGRSAPRTCARCSTCSGSRTLLEAAADGPPPEAVELAERRGAARDARDWAEADRLRDELRAMGWEVRDGPQGPELVPAG